MKQFFENLKLSSKQYKSYGTGFLLIGIFSLFLGLLFLILSAYFSFILFLAIGVLSFYIRMQLNNNSIATSSNVNNKKSSLKLSKMIAGLMFFELILFLVFIAITPIEPVEAPQEEATTQESVGEEIDFDEAIKSTTEHQTSIPKTTAPPTTVPPTVAPTQPITQQVIEPVEEYVASEEYEQTVYITETGTKYHRTSSCGNGNYWSVPISEALNRDLEPCKKCY